MNLYQWLVRSVKLDGTKARRNLFLKLERLVKVYGDPVKRHILTVWDESKTHCSEQPRDHYFAKSIKLRLIDNGMWFERNPYDGLAGAELDSMFKDEDPLELFDKPAADKPRHVPPERKTPDMTREELVEWNRKAKEDLVNKLASNTKP
jgi:hypothetical protein